MGEEKVYWGYVGEHSQRQGYLGESRVDMTRLSCPSLKPDRTEVVFYMCRLDTSHPWLVMAQEKKGLSQGFFRPGPGTSLSSAQCLAPLYQSQGPPRLAGL